MKEDIAEILKKALNLPPEAQAASAASLLDSLDETGDDEAEAAWENEIAARLDEIDDGKVKLVPWAVALRRISAK